MELHALISLFCVILWQVVGVEPIYHVARLSDQPVRIVAIIKARPLVMRAMLIKSIKRTEAQDRMFLLAGVDKVDYWSCLGMKAMFTATKRKSVRMGKAGRTKIALIREMSVVLKIPRRRLADTIEKLIQDVGKEMMAQGGPNSALADLTTHDDNCDRLVRIDCDSGSRYRTADGSCNNLAKPVWGRAFIPMRRFVPPVYQDGVSEPRTFSVVAPLDGRTRFPLPSPRMVSRTLHETNQRTSLDSVTHMVMQWGQFLDHDITSTPEQKGLDNTVPTCCIDDVSDSAKSKINMDPGQRDICFPIDIPPGDPHFRRSCLSFVRSIQVSNADCQSVPVEQLNQITAFIDGSQIYGSSLKEQASLRTFSGGLLKTSANDLLPEDEEPSCVLTRDTDYCFKAGDKRVNEQMALASMHTIWMREHNRIVRELARYNPDLVDETLFQEARKLVGAMLQLITYSEFLPIVLGPQTMRNYQLLLARDFSRDYRPQTDPSIRNAFATAAYRFGHSMIQSTMSRYDTNYNRVDQFELKESFGNTSHILVNNGDGVNTYIRGLLVDNIRRVDRFLTQQVTNHLFEDPLGNSLDLAAMNLQRGRDHGLPGYNAFRKWCRLSPATSFDGLIDHPPHARNKLRSVYRHVDDIDLFSGGVSENRVRGGLVGPTFSCILANQFRALKQGDRFWFNRDLGDLGFRPDQLRQIRNVRLARIVCDNTDTTSIQRLAFRKVSERNPRLSCEDPTVAKLDLRNWMSGPTTERLDPWAEWSACANGRRSRTRQCLSGGACRGRAEEIQRCRSRGTWAPWSAWSRCVNRMMVRTRECLRGSCAGIHTNRRRCSANPSEGWSQWGPWSSCNNEAQTRQRECLGGGCTGENIQRWYCSNGGGSGKWSEWNQWTSCANQVQTRVRFCLTGNCEGISTQRWKCSSDPFGGWNEWRQWSACVNEVQTRERTCQGTTCNGDSVQRWKCSSPNQASWAPWLNWSTCVNGNEYRARRCNGGTCEGNRSESRKCLTDRSRVPIYCTSSVYRTFASKFCPTS